MKWVLLLQSSKIYAMRNPFDLTRNDAEFVEAARDKSARQIQITRLIFGRSWTMASFILQSGFMALLLALDWRAFNDNAIWWLFAYALNGVAFAHLDLQIKFLKALEAERNDA